MNIINNHDKFGLNNKLIDKVIENNTLAIQKIKEANKLIHENISILIEEDDKVHFGLMEESLHISKNLVGEIAYINRLNNGANEDIRYYSIKRNRY